MADVAQLGAMCTVRAAMPYADPQKQKEAQARWYRAKYQGNVDFQVREANRKAGWLQTDEGKRSNAEASARARAKRRKAAKK